MSVQKSLTRKYVLTQILCSKFTPICTAEHNVHISHFQKCVPQNEVAEQHCHITLHTEQLMFEHNRGGSCGGAIARQIRSSTHTVLLFSVGHNSTTKCQVMHIYRLVSFSPSTKHIIMDAVYFRNNLYVLPLTIHVLTYNSQICTSKS